MAQVTQCRFFGFNDSHNFPPNGSEKSWIGAKTNNQEVFSLLNNFGVAVKIGIQTLPGVKFFLNGDVNNGQGIVIDHTGIYELDLRDTTATITTLYFSGDTLALIDAIDNAKLIVDIMYNPANGEQVTIQ